MLCATTLRAHGRQLGDRRHAGTGRQVIDHLVHECAYEHWHSMLFARFLAENDVLIEPNTGVAVTLEECEELAQEEGMDRWMLASRYAHRMLPQVFRPDHPAFEVQLAREHRLKLEQLVEGLPVVVFHATDSLGWVYQFWQSRKRAEVNDSEQKIGAEQLPAVTQLFTEPYMVRFLLDNSLGAWWAARQLSASDLEPAASETELRRVAALPGMPLDYLRFVQGDNATHSGWRPAAGAFDTWPDQLGELRILDPCCGSGHFLVAALSMLVPMRMEAGGARNLRCRRRGPEGKPARIGNWTRAASRSQPSLSRSLRGRILVPRATGRCRSSISPARDSRLAPLANAGPSWREANVI